MKFYGHGALLYPGTKRVIHDFEDGPFSTVNPEIIRHALAMGFSTKPLPEPAVIESKKELPVIETKGEELEVNVPEEPVKAKRGRKPKAVAE